MVLDTQEALLTYIYNLLTTDSGLQTAMGGTVRIYHTWATPDAVFPYLVYRIDISPAEPFMIRMASLFLDIWSDSQDAAEVVAIRKRIIELLDELEPSITEVEAARLWLQTEGFIPESEQYIWHYATQWNLRYYRKQEVSSIISR